jgi:hypothetical protein
MLGNDELGRMDLLAERLLVEEAVDEGAVGKSIARLRHAQSQSAERAARDVEEDPPDMRALVADVYFEEHVVGERRRALEQLDARGAGGSRRVDPAGDAHASVLGMEINPPGGRRRREADLGDEPAESSHGLVGKNEQSSRTRH